MPETYDVVVVGAGNAALSAALAAKEICGSVLVVEKAPEYFRGGNTYFTGGIIRIAFDGIEDIKTVVTDMSPTEEASVDVGSYNQDQFYADMMRVTQGLSDPELAQILVSQSLPTMQWLTQKGVRFILSYGRQAFKDGDKFRFWGGLLVEAVGAGKGLSDQQFEASRQEGIEVRYSTQGVSLIQDETGRVSGLRVLGRGSLRAPGGVLSDRYLGQPSPSAAHRPRCARPSSRVLRRPAERVLVRFQHPGAGVPR